MSSEHLMSVSAQSDDSATVETTSNHGTCSWGESNSGCSCPELPLSECYNFDSCKRFVHRLCMDKFEKQKSSDATAVTVGENMIICPSCHPWNQESPTKKRTTRITKAATEKLRQFFTNNSWPRNRSLPKANGDPNVDKIIKELGLERSQVSRQLAKWKKDTYDKAQLELLAESENIKELIEQNMSMTPTDFVDNFLGLMIDGEEIDGNANTTNLMQSLDIQPEKELKRGALKYIRRNKEHACFKSLTLFLGDLIDAMTEELPAMASMISVSEMSFASRRQTDKINRITTWRKAYEDMPSLGDGNAKFGEEKFAYFGMYVAECLFFVWIHSAAVADLPPVEIPRVNLVARYSLPVIYYVAGWTLQRVSLAKTVALSKRLKYQQFYPLHNRGFNYAKSNNLPYTLVQMREKKNLFYVSKEYFEFICLIESIYVKNLTMNMMMAYNDGNLLQIIDGEIYKNEFVREKFFALYGDESSTGVQAEEGDCEMEQDDEEADANEKEEWKMADRLEVLRFILTRYIRMRGCWFVKALKNNEGDKSLGDKRIDAAPTNMKVAILAEQSKKVATALREAANNTQENMTVQRDEQLLWDRAAEAVLAYDDNDEDEEN